MTQFSYGAINPLTIDQYTERELSEYLVQMQQQNSEGGVLNGR